LRHAEAITDKSASFHSRRYAIDTLTLLSLSYFRRVQLPAELQLSGLAISAATAIR